MSLLKHLLLFVCLSSSVVHASPMDQVPDRGCVKVKVENAEGYWATMYFEKAGGMGRDGEPLYWMASARQDGCGPHPQAKGVVKTKSEILQYLMQAGMIQLNR